MEDQESKERTLNKTLYVLVEYIGLEPEQVANLRLTDLHLAGKNPSLSVTEGNQSKTVELDLEAHRTLVGWLVSRPDSASDFLFPGSEANAMEPKEIRQAATAAKKSGISLPSKADEADTSTPASEPESPEPDQEPVEKGGAEDETIVGRPKPEDSLPFRPASPAPPPSNPEQGVPPREGAPFPPPPPPPTRPPERGAPSGPASPFPARPFPPAEEGESGPEEAEAPARKSTASFRRPETSNESRSTPRPVDEKKPRVPPKPVRRRGSVPVPVTMPGKEPDQPPIPITREPEPSATPGDPEKGQPPSPGDEESASSAEPEQPELAERAAKTEAQPAKAPPAKSIKPKKVPHMPPPPPIPKEGVNRPAIFSFVVGGGLVILALCIICVGAASLFSLQEDTRNQVLAGLGLEATPSETIREDATQAAVAPTSTPTATLPPTSTPTPLASTATPVPTETATPVPPPTQVPTDTPPPTDTPVPTDTPIPQAPASTPTPAESPTPEVSPTPAMKYGAPVLLEPEDGFRFISGNTIVLRWQPVELAPDEQYAVRMIYNFNDQLTYAGTNLKESEWTVPLSLFGKVDPPENKYEWYVQIERLNEDGSGTAISPESEHRTFTWK